MISNLPYNYTKRRLVEGVGLNDADYPVNPRKGVKCPYYSRWSAMINRCYSSTSVNHNPTYVDCKVCDEWLTFSNFKAWMETQDWEGKHLDKDLLLPNNKVYSPEFCCFLPENINTFLTNVRKGATNKVGVFYEKSSGRFAASINNPFTGKRCKIGRYPTEQAAFEAWLAKKNEFAMKLSEEIDDFRISSALRLYFKELFKC